jgi:hypothetical protein
MFVIFDSDNIATPVAYPPDGVDSAAKVEHYLVSGPLPLLPFRGTEKIADFDAWRSQKEGDGFLFEPLDI